MCMASLLWLKVGSDLVTFDRYLVEAMLACFCICYLHAMFILAHVSRIAARYLPVGGGFVHV